QDEQGNTLIHYLIRNYRSWVPDILKKLEIDFTKVPTNNRGETILHAAAKTKDFEMVSFLIGKGVDVNATDKNGNSVFHTVIKNIYREDHKALKCIDLLIKSGAKNS